MAQKQLFAALLVTAFMTLLKCIHVDYRGVFIASPEMRKFVGTREPIWTYSETGTSLVRCKVDITRTMNDRAVLFRRMYSYAGQKYSSDQWGVFDKLYKERMSIRPAGPTFYQMEQVIFMSQDYSCAVIMTTLIGTHVYIAPTRWYELRVRNSAIATGPHEECLQEFKSVTYPRRIVYTPDCQRLLATAPTADTKY
ncbi:uncharacterized protein LOC119458309 isoform X1 [Dermacentor silvarum]|uniref:uncharacterized protein LOC119458309 isoform X1 n=1 Tax=Dermacentor silvarum TaxID=543639 RepID=UPI00189AC7D4|nr:uncharacterized protein LOC119458309 isoform X1 [Dermacentor silvarum]